MAEFGRILIFLGLAVAVVGAVVWLAAKSGFRGLPGDVAIERDSVRFYFPIVTCIVISVILTVGMWFWRWISNR